MNLQTGMLMTKDAFLHWAERQEATYELVRGQIGPPVRSTRDHASIMGAFVMALRNSFPDRRWNIFARGLAVDTGVSVRFPDILMEPVGGDREGTFSEAPVLLAEVLSPSSLETDLHEKAVEYTALASLQAYVVLAQNEPRLWVWQRDENGVFPKAGEMIDGEDAILKLYWLDIELPLVDIYRGVR